MNLKHKKNYYITLLAILVMPLSACVTSSGSKDIQIEKISTIDSDPVTRLSFTPVESEYDNIEIVVYQSN